MKKNYHITVVGNGLTGLTASLAFSSLGYKIALVDPKPLLFNKGLFPDNRTTAISSGSVIFYKKIGVWESLKKYACPIKKILVEESSTKLNTTFSSGMNKEKVMGYMIENKNLLETLIYLAKKNKNIIKYDNKLLKFHRKQKEAFVILDNGISISSKLIIGADGRKSYLRKLAKIQYKFKDYRQKAFTFNIEHENKHNNLAIEKFLEEGPLAILPISSKNKKKLLFSCLVL